MPLPTPRKTPSSSQRPGMVFGLSAMAGAAEAAAVAGGGALAPEVLSTDHVSDGRNLVMGLRFVCFCGCLLLCNLLHTEQFLAWKRLELS